MNLKTRPVMLATAALSFVAAALIVWQIAKSPSATTNISSGSSGLVTPTTAPPQMPSAQITDAAGVAAPAVVPSAPPPAGATTANAPDAPNAPHAPNAIKHPVAPATVAHPPILPNEVDAAVIKSLGRKSVLRSLFYLDPLARRFVASVDGLGRKLAPDELWLLRPAPGEIKLAKSSKQPDTQLIKKANGPRYARFVKWIAHTDNATLIALYARMYPLLQQTYVDLGHPDGYFNDRVIEVIDLMLATPNARRPLRVQPASADKLPGKASAISPQRSRPYVFSDPALESLATGQKILLRMNPQDAAQMKLKLKTLRSGLVKLGQQPGKS